jgi:response regulator RpfG family c-di-GMP phosphodiesterase
MEDLLKGRKVLIVEGLTLASQDIREALAQQGAHVFVARGVAAAFRLLDRIRFDAVVIDHSLHNEAVDLCIELRTESIPYVSCRAPNSWQGWSVRKREAEAAARKLENIFSRAALDAMGVAGRREGEASSGATMH